MSKYSRGFDKITYKKILFIKFCQYFEENEYSNQIINCTRCCKAKSFIYVVFEIIHE